MCLKIVSNFLQQAQLELAERKSAQPAPELIRLQKEMERLKVELERKRRRGREGEGKIGYKERKGCLVVPFLKKGNFCCFVSCI